LQLAGFTLTRRIDLSMFLLQVLFFSPSKQGISERFYSSFKTRRRPCSLSRFNADACLLQTKLYGHGLFSGPLLPETFLFRVSTFPPDLDFTHRETFARASRIASLVSFPSELPFTLIRLGPHHLSSHPRYRAPKLRPFIHVTVVKVV